MKLFLLITLVLLILAGLTWLSICFPVFGLPISFSLFIFAMKIAADDAWPS